MQDSAVASVSPRSRRRRSTSSAVGVSSSRRGTAPHRPRAGLRSRRREHRRPSLDEEVDVQLEVPRADRHVDAVTVASGGGERPCDGRLRDAEEAERAAARCADPRCQAHERICLEHARPELQQLSRRPRQRHRHARAGLEDDRRRRSDHAHPARAVGQRRLLDDTVGEVDIGAVEPGGNPLRELLDRLAQRLFDV